jgi:hypothetical protein
MRLLDGRRAASRHHRTARLNSGNSSSGYASFRGASGSPANGIRALWTKISNSFQLQPAHDGGFPDRPRTRYGATLFAVDHPGYRLGLMFGLVSVVATAEKDRASEDPSLTRVDGGAPGRPSTYALPVAAQRTWGAKGKHHKPPYSSPPSISISDAYPRTIESAVSIPLVSLLFGRADCR